MCVQGANNYIWTEVKVLGFSKNVKYNLEM